MEEIEEILFNNRNTVILSFPNSSEFKKFGDYSIEVYCRKESAIDSLKSALNSIGVNEYSPEVDEGINFDGPQARYSDEIFEGTNMINLNSATIEKLNYHLEVKIPNYDYIVEEKPISSEDVSKEFALNNLEWNLKNKKFFISNDITNNKVFHGQNSERALLIGSPCQIDINDVIEPLGLRIEEDFIYANEAYEEAFIKPSGIKQLIESGLNFDSLEEFNGKSSLKIKIADRHQKKTDEGIESSDKLLSNITPPSKKFTDQYFKNHRKNHGKSDDGFSQER